MAKNIPSNENQRLATKNTYPARLSVKMEGQIKSFPGKRSLKEYTSIKPALQEMIRDCFKERKEKRKREEHR